MTPNQYLQAVQRRLNARAGTTIIEEVEMPLIVMGYMHSVGADDCACQLIADREDKIERGG
jgi:hypothetical protein